MTDNDAPSVTHYIVTFTGRGDPANGVEVAHELGEGLKRCGIDLIMARSYISKIEVDPVQVGLKDSWMNLEPGDKEEMAMRFPHLAMAIMLVTGIGEEG